MNFATERKLQDSFFQYIMKMDLAWVKQTKMKTNFFRNRHIERDIVNKKLIFFLAVK